MIRSAIIAGMLLILVAVAPTASADSVTWTLNNLIFTDGSTGTGSFVYDATTNTLSSINIVTSSGALFTGATYTAVDPGFGPFAFDIALVTKPSLASYMGMPVLELEFFTDATETTFQSLTNAGGVLIAELNELTCNNAACSAATEIRGTLFGGTVTGVVNTQEPASVVLLGVGLFGLIGAAKRRPVNT